MLVLLEKLPISEASSFMVLILAHALYSSIFGFFGSYQVNLLAPFEHEFGFFSLNHFANFDHILHS
jgi:hypothetical protein